MKHITCHLDFISPYAYLAFETLPRALEGLSYSMRYRPVLFGALLKHHGQLGPAEIAAKRDWTYRQVLWLAHVHGVPMQMPSAHPFNPLALLRLAVAMDADGAPNRYVCETIFRHVWQGGHDAADPARLDELTRTLSPPVDPQGEEARERLKANTAQAVSAGLFGVPTFEVDGRPFWGLDALPMLRAWLEGDAWFDGPDWDVAQRTAVGVTRPR
jgi:2-hydroxychromene-2-carboxylate isomerase